MINSTLPKSFTCQMNQIVLTTLMSKAKLFKVIKSMVEGKTLGHDDGGVFCEVFACQWRELHLNGS